MSWVFLTDEHALKLKKPVRFPFLDFCTLAARAHFCAEEVQLNRRLAPGVYLGLQARGMAAPSRRSPPKPCRRTATRSTGWC